jgi:hypothetical protein
LTLALVEELVRPADRLHVPASDLATVGVAELGRLAVGEGGAHYALTARELAQLAHGPEMGNVLATEGSRLILLNADHVLVDVSVRAADDLLVAAVDFIALALFRAFLDVDDFAEV